MINTDIKTQDMNLKNGDHLKKQFMLQCMLGNTIIHNSYTAFSIHCSMTRF